MKIFQSIGKLVLGIIGLFVVIGILVVACSSDDTTKVISKDGTTTEESGDVKAKLGDTVQVGDWEYTFTNAKTAKSVKGIMGITETPDSDQFIVIKVKAKNVGKDKCTLSEGFFHLKDKDGAEYDASSKIENGFMLKALNPHGSATGDIAFEVPKGKVSDFKLEADGGFSSSKKITVELG